MHDKWREQTPVPVWDSSASLVQYQKRKTTLAEQPHKAKANTGEVSPFE